MKFKLIPWSEKFKRLRLRLLVGRSGTNCDRIAALMFTALRYYWITAKGYRLRPWASPYIRWRLGTFYGGDMHSLGPGEFFRLMWRERARSEQFLAWMAERWRVQSGSKS